ncbi:MAG: hypothetical protein KC621_35060, partial [Myxococcales bacterium]|nr:hypothetical protein [Myxococcales bacterium]
LESNEGLAGGGFAQLALGGPRWAGFVQVGGASWSTFTALTPGTARDTVSVRIGRLEALGGLRLVPLDGPVVPTLALGLGAVARIVAEGPASPAPVLAGSVGGRARLAHTWYAAVDARLGYDLVDARIPADRSRLELDPFGAALLVSLAWVPGRS